MPRILMLDIGGVFYRGWPDEDFWPRWTTRTGLSRADLETWLSTGDDARLARLGQITAAEYHARAAARHGAKPETFRTLLKDAYASEFNTRFADFVRGLGAGGLPVWALTNSLSTEAVWMRRPGFEGLFTGVISSCDCGLAKPDPAIFAMAARRAGARPDDILFVDDITSHVEAARAAGFEALTFTETDRVIAELNRRFSAGTPQRLP